MSTKIFQRIAGNIDIPGATRWGSERNDLLPPRFEDNVAGEVGRRFSEGLSTRLARGHYDPTPAVVVSVPKPGHTTRPAALLSLSDRIVYESLVEALRPRIEAAMVGSGIAYWPRGVAASTQWRRFEAECLEGQAPYIALADVTAYYETIEHEKLREVLTDLTGRRQIVDALVEFLGRVMRARKGLPQGLGASDALATAYLTPLDHAMSRECIDYRRHGDDMRIGAASMGEAKQNLYLLECELRRHGLMLSGSKALIMRAENYRLTLNEGDRVVEETRRALLDARIQALQNDQNAIEELLETADRNDLGWQFFYHGSLSFEDMVAQLVDHLSAPDAEVAATVFQDAMTHRPGTGAPLSKEAFHHRVTSSLVRLAAARSPIAVRYVQELLTVAPEKTGVAAGYLMALPASEGLIVLDEVFPLLEGGVFRTAWEKAWLLRVVQHFAGRVGRRRQRIIAAIGNDEDEPVLARVEAIKALAAIGTCDRMLVRRLWNTASVVFHPDLVAAAYLARESEAWCSTFLDGVRDDPINIVVLRHLEA